jgi:hypothetical protein
VAQNSNDNKRSQQYYPGDYLNKSNELASDEIKNPSGG